MVRIALMVVGLVVTFAAFIALSVYAKQQLRKRIDAPARCGARLGRTDPLKL
jgi:hypothetical protein